MTSDEVIKCGKQRVNDEEMSLRRQSSTKIKTRQAVIIIMIMWWCW